MPYTRPSFLRLRAFPEEGQRCCLAESLVWSVGVVDILPSAKKLVHLGEGAGAVCQILFRLPDAVWAQEGAARMPGVSAGGFNQPAVPLEASQDATDH